MGMYAVSPEGKIDFPSRISGRAVVAGAFVSLAVMSVLLSLGGGLGVVPSMMDAAEMRRAGGGLIVWSTLSWVAAVFAGSLVASMSAKATDIRDGLLNGAATWAVASLSTGVLSGVWLLSGISLDLLSADAAAVLTSRAALWSYSVAEILAIGAALAGGFVGTRTETRLPHRLVIRREERTQTMPSRPAQSM
jgi:hypothetical protein